MKSILTIWKKELKDTIRDRRTLLSSIILPMVLMPGIIVGMGKLTKLQIEQAQEKTVTVGVVNAAASEDFLAVLLATPKMKISTIDGDPAAAVREKKADLVIILPEEFGEAARTEQPITLEAYKNSLNDRSSLALTKVATAATQFNQSLLQTRLTAAGSAPTILNGVAIHSNETATEQELGGFGLGFLLPLFIILWATVGGQYTAVDVSAGEKERKTLESLFLTPVRRVDIVFGKFLAVGTTALLSVVIALSSLYAVFVFGGSDLFSSMNTSSTGVVQQAQSSFNFSLEPMAILIMFLISIILVALFSAINLTVSIFAKSFKEAQSYIGPSYLVIILPVVAFNTIPGFVPTNGFFAIPVVNAVLLFKEVLVGTFNSTHIIFTTITLALTALVAIIVASRLYQREGVLFKT